MVIYYDKRTVDYKELKLEVIQIMKSGWKFTHIIDPKTGEIFQNEIDKLLNTMV